MATQIGPKIGVDGEAQYRSQMANIIQQAKTLDAEMRALKTSFDDETDAQARATKEAELNTERIRVQEERVRLLAEQLEKSAKETGENSTKTLQYREILANAQAVLNDMRRTTGEAAEETEDFADAEEEAGRGAVSAGELIKAHLVSEALLKGLSALADLAKKTGEALYGAVRAAASYADNYLTLATVTGMSTDELQEFGYMAELIDVPLETITGSIGRMTRTMDSARGGTGDAADAFARLGVRVTNADGTLRDANVVFFEVIDALGQMEDGSERDALAMTIFGKSARELNPLIAQGSEGLRGFAEEAHQMGYVLDHDTLETLGRTDDAFQRLQRTGETVQNRLGAAVAPVVTEFAEGLLDLAQDLDWEQIGEAVAGVLGTIGDKVLEFVGNLDAAKIADTIETSFAWLEEHGDNLVTVIEAIGIAFGTWKAVTVVKGLASTLGTIIDKLEVVGGLVSGLGTTLGIGTAATAGGIGTVLLGGYVLADRIHDMKTVGFLEGVDDLRTLAENVAYWDEEVARAQKNYDDAVAGGVIEGLFQYQDALDQSIIFRSNAVRQYNETLVRLMDEATTTLSTALTENSAATADAYRQAMRGPDDFIAETDEDIARILEQGGVLQSALEGLRPQLDAAKAEGVLGLGEEIEKELTQAVAATDGAVPAISGAATSAIQEIERVPTAIREDFVPGVDKLGQSVSDSMQEANSVFAANAEILSDNAAAYGVDMMASFAEGMVEGFNAFVVPASNDALESLRSSWGHSEPKTGPLSDDSTWMPDMMRSFGEGFRRGFAQYLEPESLAALDALAGQWTGADLFPGLGRAPTATDALRGLDFDLGDLLAARGGGGSVNYGGVSVVIYASEGQSAEELFEEFSYRLQAAVEEEEAVYA